MRKGLSMGARIYPTLSDGTGLFYKTFQDFVALTLTQGGPIAGEPWLYDGTTSGFGATATIHSSNNASIH
jgi:hypothetical protein